MSCSDDAIKSFRGITQQSPPCSRQECSVWPSPPPRRFAGRAWGPIAPHRRIFLGRSRVQANLKDIPRIPCQLCSNDPGILVPSICYLPGISLAKQNR